MRTGVSGPWWTLKPWSGVPARARALARRTAPGRRMRRRPAPRGAAKNRARWGSHRDQFRGREWGGEPSISRADQAGSGPSPCCAPLSCGQPHRLPPNCALGYCAPPPSPTYSTPTYSLLPCCPSPAASVSLSGAARQGGSYSAPSPRLSKLSSACWLLAC